MYVFIAYGHQLHYSFTRAKTLNNILLVVRLCEVVEVLELFGPRHHVLPEAVGAREVREAADLPPRAIPDPARVGVFKGVVHRDAAREEEPELRRRSRISDATLLTIADRWIVDNQYWVALLLLLGKVGQYGECILSLFCPCGAPYLQLGGEHEGEEQLVLLKERAAHVLVQEEGEVLREVAQADVQIVTGRGVCDRLDEQVAEPLQAVLVHGVDVGHVLHGEKEERRVLRYRLVAHARLVDLHLRHLRNLLLHCDLVGEHLRGAQHLRASTNGSVRIRIYRSEHQRERANQNIP
eukprot:1195902-Prorocentrum_minimum.AAC.5